MEQQKLSELLFQILQAELQETVTDSLQLQDELTPEVIAALYAMSKHHDLAHIVSSFLYKQGLLDGTWKEKFQKQEILSVYRYEQMKLAYEEICQAFEAAEIDYIPLKGSVIRPYYPKESMRTSCDIDILIYEDALETAIAVMEQKGYVCKERAYHDVSLFSPFGIHLELHFNIQENMENLDRVLCRAWEYAVPVTGHHYAFSDAFFLYHMFAHMAYHFLSGGCGIRPLMDIWVMEHKRGLTYPIAKELLEEAGIYTFAREITNLVDVCFSDAEKDDMTDTLLTYVIEGGVYGTVENHIAVETVESGGVGRYVWKRLFMPYKNMVVLYPILRKLPILLPFCWIARIFRMIFGGKLKKSISTAKTADGLTREEKNKIQSMKDRLGLK